MWRQIPFFFFETWCSLRVRITALLYGSLPCGDNGPDLMVWYYVLICCYDIFLWSISMIFFSDLLLWFLSLICWYDIFLWSEGMIFFSDLLVSYIFLICWYDILFWSVGMIFFSDLLVWYFSLIWWYVICVYGALRECASTGKVLLWCNSLRVRIVN